MLISIVVPCYKSAKNLEYVVAEIKTEFAKHTNYDYQIILVNDCSPDNTFDIIQKLCKEDKKIIGVNLSRNFGQASAQLASLPYIDGEIAVFMDDDGQHPASGIFQLTDKILEGNDIVYAHFKQKKHSGFKRLTSSLHRKLGEITGNKPKGIYISSFYAWSRFCIDIAQNYKSPFPSTGAYLYKNTTRISNVEIQHRDRLHGNSGYTFKKLIILWLNYFTNFSIVPVRIVSATGGICAIAGFLFGLFTLIRKLVIPNISAGFTSLLSAILFMGGLIIIILGLLGEYLGRIYMIMSNLPQYSVRETINAEKNKKDIINEKKSDEH